MGLVARRVSSPSFVGRAEELAALRDALERAGTGIAGVALVGGESGVGKSRLLAELASAARDGGARVLQGDCIELGEGELPYAPIVGALRDLARVIEPGTLDDLPVAGRQELGRLVPELAPAVAQDDAPSQPVLFEAVLALLARLAIDEPVLLAVEEVHWADRSTRDLFAFLARNLRRERVLVVPVYLACQFTDEQTGGHCPDLAEHFTGTSRKWFTFTNGTHVDSLDPETFNRWYDFLQLYVAHQAPITKSAVIQAGAPVIYQQAMGINGVTLPPDPIQQQATYGGALAAFERLQPIRVLFDSGAGGTSAGQPKPGFEQSFPRFPVPGTVARSWYLGAGGKLASRPPAHAGANKFKWNAHARPLTDFTGDTAAGTNGLWTATPPYKWSQNPAGSAVSYLTSPLSANTTVVGAGAVRVWVRSSRSNVDLQATISEIRPDGKETFVQGGWVRGNERKLDARKSTLLEPTLSLRARDVKPLSRSGSSRSRSRSTTRATPTAPARASA